MCPNESKDDEDLLMNKESIVTNQHINEFTEQTPRVVNQELATKKSFTEIIDKGLATANSGLDTYKKIYEVKKVKAELDRMTEEKSEKPDKKIDIELSEYDQKRSEELREDVKCFWKEVSLALKASPEIQNKNMECLQKADESLNKKPLSHKDIVDGEIEIAKVRSELEKARIRDKSYMIVGSIFYIFLGLVLIAFKLGLAGNGVSNTASALALNSQLVVGIPSPVWIWAIIGSLTSMLLRAGQFPFEDLHEAMSWLLFRPIVGVVMGVLTYLMVIAGLIVFSGSGKPQAPELIWVIAFVGSFSDTLSINLLQRILGQFQPVEIPKEKK